MITAGLLERARLQDNHPSSLYKGGGVLELRLRDRAHATKDLDVALHHADADLAITLERAPTSESYQGFSFRSKRNPLVFDNGAIHMEFVVSYRGGAWASISIDIARNESGNHEIECSQHDVARPLQYPF